MCENVQNHGYVCLMWTIKKIFLFVCIQTTFLLFWEYYELSVGRNKADKTPENNNCSLSHENSPSQQYSPVTLTPLRSVILVNTSDSSQENHHYRKQCSEADGTDKNKAIPSRQLHRFWTPTHSTAAAAPVMSYSVSFSPQRCWLFIHWLKASFSKELMPNGWQHYSQ